MPGMISSTIRISALGIYLATVADKVPSRVYNIGSGVGVSLE